MFKRKAKKINRKVVQHKNLQGASRRVRKVQGERWLDIQKFTAFLSVPRLLVFAAVCVGVIALYGSLMAVKTVLNIPVEQVEIQGELEFQTHKQIADIINHYVVNGFVSVDLQQLQKELVALPWIHEVAIKRKMEQGLLIQLQEQKPVAYWNHDSLINQYGEVFTPESVPVIAGLPVFSGKDHAKVLGVYQRVLATLPEAHLPLRAVEVDARNVVQVSLSTQTELVMNYLQLAEQLERWRVIADAGLSRKLNEVKRVDLRYSNGAAVSWKNNVAVH